MQQDLLLRYVVRDYNEAINDLYNFLVSDLNIATIGNYGFAISAMRKAEQYLNELIIKFPNYINLKGIALYIPTPSPYKDDIKDTIKKLTINRDKLLEKLLKGE